MAAQHLDPFKVINYDTFDFKNSSIIKPNTENFDETHRIPTKSISVIINSADRNEALYPAPNEYVAELYEEIQDVISVELKFASLPYNPYNITSANDKITIDGNTYTLKHGKYNGTDLAFALTHVRPNWIVSYDEVTQHMQFFSDYPFTINGDQAYIKGSVMKTIGLSPATRTAVFDTKANAYVIESLFAIDLSANNTIVMNIDTMNVKVSNNNVFNKAFGVLLPNLGDMRTADTYTVKKNFNPPVARMEKLRIRFLDIYGNPYDFQNKDHILEFQVDSHKNIRKYQAYTT